MRPPLTRSPPAFTPEPMTPPAEASHRGGDIPGSGEAAFTLRISDSLPVLICAPHAGRHYPADILARLRAPREAALRLEDRHVDLLAQGAADETGASLLIAHAPRAVIDLN